MVNDELAGQSRRTLRTRKVSSDVRHSGRLLVHSEFEVRGSSAPSEAAARSRPSASFAGNKRKLAVSFADPSNS